MVKVIIVLTFMNVFGQETEQHQTRSLSSIEATSKKKDIKVMADNDLSQNTYEQMIEKQIKAIRERENLRDN